jgi:hypothetical protein
MRKLLSIVLITIITSANAQLEKSATEKYSVESLVTTDTQVKVIRAINVIQTCELESKQRGMGGFRGAIFEACSFYTKNECTIIVGYTTNNDILGHEFRHCIQGNFH